MRNEIVGHGEATGVPLISSNLLQEYIHKLLIPVKINLSDGGMSQSVSVGHISLGN